MASFPRLCFFLARIIKHSIHSEIQLAKPVGGWRQLS